MDKKKLIKDKDGFVDIADAYNISIDFGSNLEIMDAADKKKDRLVVEVKATHADKIINNRLYPAPRMKAAIPSWMEPYAKPVLVNHDTDRDPIGRVIDAEYVDTIDMGASKTKIEYSEEGSGYILLTLDIVDPAAIEKILDGRYDTVSQRLQTDSLVCSICGSDWIKGDYCEHDPGVEDKDTGEMCYLRTGRINYSEVSFVSIPADPLASVISTTADSLIVISEEDHMMMDLQRSDKKNLFDSTKGKSLLSLVDKQQKHVNLDVKPDTAMTDDTVGDVILDKEDNLKMKEKTKEEIKDEKVASDKKIEEATKKVIDSSKELSDELKGVKDACTALSNEKDKIQESLDAANISITALTEEKDNLMTENEKVNKDLKKSLAGRVVDMKLGLKRVSADSVEARNELVETYVAREKESLEDSLEDLIQEKYTSASEDKSMYKDDSEVDDKSVTDEDKKDKKETKDTEEEVVIASPKDLTKKKLFGSKKQ